MNFLMHQEVPNQDFEDLDLFEEFSMYETTFSKFVASNTYMKNLEEKKSCCFYENKTNPIQSSLQVPFNNEFNPISPQFHEATLSYNPLQNRALVHGVSNSGRLSESPVSSNYSASPLESPSQQCIPDVYLGYMNRNAIVSRYQNGNCSPYFYNGILSERRNKRDEQLSYEEYEKRRLRRERNKEAALRCRTRRRERIDALEQETASIEQENLKVNDEIAKLEKQVNEMQKLLREHKCKKHIKQ